LIRPQSYADRLRSSGWREGGFFLVQLLDIDCADRKIKGVEYIGYDDSNKYLRSYVLSNEGPGPFEGLPSRVCGR
jgi:hypothetical protein